MAAMICLGGIAFSAYPERLNRAGWIQEKCMLMDTLNGKMVVGLWNYFSNIKTMDDGLRDLVSANDMNSRVLSGSHGSSGSIPAARWHTSGTYQ